jgi:hypothetical protein
VEALGPVTRVWSGGGVALTECPRSAVTGASWSWLEAYGAYRAGGQVALDGMPAKDAEAWLVLEQERGRENRDEQR